MTEILRLFPFKNVLKLLMSVSSYCKRLTRSSCGMARLNSADFTPLGLTDNFMGNTLLCDCPFYLFFYFERKIPFAREYGGSSLWTCLRENDHA